MSPRIKLKRFQTIMKSKSKSKHAKNTTQNIQADVDVFVFRRNGTVLES